MIAEASEGWWNGINVLIRDPDNAFDEFYPPTHRSRLLYENDHLVHSDRYASLAPQSVDLLYWLMRLNPARFALSLYRLFREGRRLQSDEKGQFRSMNTYSDAISAKERFNPRADI